MSVILRCTNDNGVVQDIQVQDQIDLRLDISARTHRLPTQPGAFDGRHRRGAPDITAGGRFFRG
jgi:hypothetical protein